MFGYIRPLRGELKCKEFDLYKATYCGLCQTMRQRYGVIAPMFLNFDFTFLALLLWEAEEDPKLCHGRCHAKLFTKKEMCVGSDALNYAADESVILAYWKLRDSIVDDGFWKGLISRSLALLLKRSYKKAALHCAEFDKTVQDCLAELSQLERENSPSIDRTADTFARILRAAAPQKGDEVQDRALGQLLYHVGRWIYLVDARDDIAEDALSGSYNPIALRYGETGDDDALRLTLEHSLNLARSAYHIGEFGCRGAIIQNILYLGLPLVQRAVFEGVYKNIKKQKIGSK